MHEQGNGEAGGLRRAIGSFDATMLVAGSVVGVGIFVIPAQVAAGLCGREGLIPAAWLLGALLALTGGLTFAELARLRPRTGGLYAYLRDALGPFPAFLFGWNLLLISTTGSIAGIADIFSMHLAPLVHLSGAGLRVAAMAAVLGLTALNCVGVRQGSRTLSVVTVLKLATLFGITAAGLWFWASRAGLEPAPPCPSPVSGSLLLALGAATLPVLWTFGGWQQVTYVAGEIKDPRRTTPRALLFGIVMVTVCYLAVNAAYLAVRPASTMASLGDESIAVAVMGRILGPTGRTATSLAIVLSALGITHSYILTSPRIYHAMARDGVFFQWLAKIDAMTGTPIHAILLQGVLAAFLVLVMDFSALVIYTVFAECIFFALAGVSLFILRRREQAAASPGRFLARGGPVAPVVFMACEMALFLSAILSFPRESLYGALVLAAGALFFVFWRRFNRR